MTWLKDLYVSRQYTDSLYHLSGVPARQTEKLAKEIWAPCTLVSATQKAWELMPVLEACQRAFIDRCDELPGKEEAARLASAMCDAADKLTAREEPA
jgi:hypothetical protein